jgi:cyclopropane-fatty-acyl-phospholipid synthase
MTGAADLLAPTLEALFAGPPPFRLRAWDGSETGPQDGPLLLLRSRRALRRMLWHPGELGLAEAYVAGDLELVGDLGAALRSVWECAERRGLGGRRLGVRDAWQGLGTALRLGAAGLPPRAPGLPARQRGTLHSRSRDRAAIRHHYDLSNDFYALLLDDSMAYSCGYWTRSASPGYGLAEAQTDKLDLICGKLDLSPGDRLLDIGCGWGSLTLHAAAACKARVTAVTLSGAQAAFVRERVRERGLEELVEVLQCDYRDIPRPAEGYDAVATVEMGEHVGEAAYPGFAAVLHRMLRPGGLVLVQQMSRSGRAPGGGAFIETYIAPDMHMRPLDRTIGLLAGAGLEILGAQALREHYVRTIAAWRDTLEERWEQAVRLVGEETARVWRLYLVGGGLAFEQGRMGVDQILARRPTASPAGGAAA